MCRALSTMNPLWQTLAEAEEAVRSGKRSVIIFIRDHNARGQEISGYIDYGHRSAQPQVVTC